MFLNTRQWERQTGDAQLLAGCSVLSSFAVLFTSQSDRPYTVVFIWFPLSPTSLMNNADWVDVVLQSFVNILVSMAKLVSQETGSRAQKEKALRKALWEQNELLDLGGLPLPVDPSIRVNTIVPEATLLFNSNLMPMKLSFKSENNQTYVTIFKRGDDLRYDFLWYNHKVKRFLMAVHICVWFFEGRYVGGSTKSKGTFDISVATKRA